MRDGKIAVVAVQETHLDDGRRMQLESLFSRRMKIHCSPDPENPTRRGGVAIVVNKQILDTSSMRERVIIPGRAIMVKLKWHGENSLRVLAVYAPNDQTVNDHPTQKPDIMLGDFNMVEDAIDRLPTHGSNEDLTNAFDDLKYETRLLDGWRNTYPSQKAFTFVQNNEQHSQSRIDRIYLTEGLFQMAREWKIETSGIPNADHRMVSVKIANDSMPELGKGRWSMPLHLIKDEPLRKYVQERGKEAEDKVKRLGVRRTDDQNAQLIYAAFKKDVRDMARKRERAIVPKIIQQIRELEDKLNQVNNDDELTETEKGNKAANLNKKITNLQRK
ncbi:Endonuclease/exonuclease/phosphatase [Gymnopilus junonius]|uniref:Endonuclease/exonuclease/phosphatase n=1 Tax=Gymnopilus junonius TaxID=109634 RepID=A0A9P5TNL2_GYMJU|nr:Endonuclease/exonuclease/phosphatase [Gymnopilus junonius]